MIIKAAVLKGWGPGGWTFYQPETDWHAPGPLENTFDQQVQNIIKMREANPSKNLTTDPVKVGEELEQYTVARWRSTYSEHGMQRFLENPTVLKKKAPTSITQHPSLLNRVAGLAGIDTAALEEWLGAGGLPVESELSTRRALVCAECSQGNVKAGWRDMLTVPAAEALKVYLELKNRLQLSTPVDDALGICSPCRCVLTLKVHVPLKHIIDNTKVATLDKMKTANEKCWVINEK